MSSQLPFPDLYRITADLECRAQEKEDPRALRQDVECILDWAEANSAPVELLNRLDSLLVNLTEASRDNVCANTKCPHFNKKCRMR